MSSGTDDLLSKALTSLSMAGAGLDGYHFIEVAGTTQATVWKGTSHDGNKPALALRLTPKPFELLLRICTLIDHVREVECPRTLQLAQLTVEGRTWTVQVCTWIGTGVPWTADMRALGQHLARLHRCMATTSLDFTDRTLSFERHSRPPSDQPLPAW